MDQQNLIEVNSKKMSGTPVFRGTRVPIQNLFDCIEATKRSISFSISSPPSPANRLTGFWNSLKKGCSKVKLLLDECVTRHLKREPRAIREWPGPWQD